MFSCPIHRLAWHPTKIPYITTSEGIDKQKCEEGMPSCTERLHSTHLIRTAFHCATLLDLARIAYVKSQTTAGPWTTTTAILWRKMKFVQECRFNCRPTFLAQSTLRGHKSSSKTWRISPIIHAASDNEWFPVARHCLLTLVVRPRQIGPNRLTLRRHLNLIRITHFSKPRNSEYLNSSSLPSNPIQLYAYSTNVIKSEEANPSPLLLMNPVSGKPISTFLASPSLKFNIPENYPKMILIWSVCLVHKLCFASLM